MEHLRHVVTKIAEKKRGLPAQDYVCIQATLAHAECHEHWRKIPRIAALSSQPETKAATPEQSMTPQRAYEILGVPLPDVYHPVPKVAARHALRNMQTPVTGITARISAPTQSSSPSIDVLTIATNVQPAEALTAHITHVERGILAIIGLRAVTQHATAEETATESDSAV